MSQFTDILADVYTLTARSDLVAESKLGIRAATIKLHGLEYWREDRIEEEIPVATVAGQFSLDASEDFSYAPRPNSLLVKKAASDSFFEEINPKQLLDGFGFRRFDVFYRAGNLYKFLTSSQDSSVVASYYRMPTATEVAYESWIADLYPHFIAVEAALFAANTVSDSELEKRMQAMAAMNLAHLNINHLDPN